MDYIEYLKSIFGEPTVIFYEEPKDGDEKVEDKDGGDDGDDDLDKKTFTKDDMERAIERRQKALKEKRKIEQEYLDLKKKMETLPKVEEYEQLKTNFQTIKQQMDEIAKKKEDEDLAKMNEKEREHIQERKKLETKITELTNQLFEVQNRSKDFDDKIKKYQEKVDKYQSFALENSIMIAAKKYNAYNEKQVVNLLKAEFKLDDKGDWVHEIYNQRGELADVLDVEERVKIFLQDPENENLLTAKVKPGSGTTQTNRQQNRDSGTTEEPTEEMYLWAKKRDFDITKDSPKEKKAKLIKWYNGLVKGIKPENK